jgi:hypothetical protein
MAISFVAASSVVVGLIGDTSLTVSPPTGYAAGDLLLIICPAGTSVTAPPTVPTGWIQLQTTSNINLTTFYKYATAIEASTTFTVPAPAQKSAIMVAYRGVGAIQALNGVVIGSGTSISTTGASVTTTYANDFVLNLYGTAGVAPTYALTAPSGTTTRVNVTTGSYGILLVDELQATAGASAGRTATIANSANSCAYQFALIPARTVYWVGGNGTWSTPGPGTTGTMWADSSGGAGGKIAPWQGDAVIINGSSGSPVVTLSGTPKCESLTTTGATCTLTSTGTLTIGAAIGGMALSTTTTWSATGLLTLALGAINTNTVTINSPITIDGVGNTVTLGSNLTVATTATTTLNAGTLALSTFTLSTGLFNSNNSNTRVLAFGTGALTATGSGTSFNMTTVTNFSYTGTSQVNVSNNSATATTVITGAVTEAQALNFNYTTGTYTLTETTPRYKNINWTGFATAVPNTARTIYGDWTNGAGNTFTAGANAQTFAATSGTQTITSNAVALDFPITQNGTGGTLALGSALTLGATRTFTVSAGTFTPGFDISAGLYSLTGGTINMGSNTFTATGSGTAWSRTSATINAGTSTITFTAASGAVAFAGGGATYYNFVLAGGANNSALTITGSNTFNTLSSTRTGIYALTLPASTTTTVGTWSISGSSASTNYVTLQSSTAGTAATLSVASGTVNIGYAKIKDSTATGGATFNGSQALNQGNVTGWSIGTGSLYWVGGTGTWDTTATTNWSLTSGGTGGTFVPASTDQVFFDANSGSGTVTLTGALNAKSIDTTGSLFTFSGTGTPIIYGNFTLSSTTVWSATGVLQISGTATITTNGVTLSSPLTLNATATTFTLGGALTTTGALFFVIGNLNLNGFDLTCLSASVSPSFTRTLAFGSNYINLTNTSSTVLNLPGTNGTTFTGAGGFKLIGASTSGQTRTITQTTSNTAATTPNIFITGGAAGSIVTTTASSYLNSLNCTGFGGTFQVPATAFTLFGSLTLSSGMTFTPSTNTVTFASTTTGNTITSAGKSFYAVAFTGVGGGWILQDNFTATSTITLTNGTLDLNNFTSTAPTFSSNNSNTRALAFGTTGAVTVTGSGTVFDATTLTGFTYTGTSAINISNNSATATTVITGAPTEAQALNFNYTTGTYTLTENNGAAGDPVYKGINWTGFGTAVPNIARTIYGDWTNSASNTFTAGTNVQTFSATSGTQTITGNSVTLDFPVTKNAAGTLVLGSALVLGAINGTFTVSAGTFTPGFDISAGFYSLTGGTINMGSYTWTVSGTTTCWTRTSATINPGTSTITFTNSINTTTFAGGGATYYNFVLAGGANAQSFIITGANTFNTLSSTRTGIYQIRLPAVTTTTVTTWGITGTSASTNYINLTSSTGSTAATLSVASGTVDIGYAKIAYSTATGGATFNASKAINQGNNTGWTFTGTGNILYWVGGTGTWSTSATTNWSLTSGGTGNSFVPTVTEAVIFNANSGSGTVTLTGSLNAKSIDTTGSSFTFSSTGTILFLGNFTLSSTTVWSATGQINFSATSTITTNGVTLSCNLQFNNGGITVTLGSNLTLATTRTLTLSQGIFNLNNFTLSTGLFNSAAGSTRAISFGTTGAITCTGSGTVFDMTTVTNFSTTGTSTINISNNSATATTVITGTPTEAQALNFNYTTGTYALTDTAAVYKNLNLTGFAGTFPNSARTIYGNWTNPASGITYTAGANAQTFAATSGTQTITSNAVTLDFPFTQNGAGGTTQLAGALTIGATRTFILTAGTLDLNNLTLTTGLFQSNTSSTRAIAFGTTGAITCNAAGGTLFDMPGTLGFTYTGNSTINISNNSATATTVNTGSGEAVSLNFNFTTGTYTLTENGGIGVYKNINWTGFAAAVPNTARTIYGNWTNSGSNTFTAGANAQTFSATSGTQTITSNTVTFDFPITKDAAATLVLGGTLTLGATRAFTVSAGTFTPGFNISAGSYSFSTAGITVNMGGNNFTAASTGTVWAGAAATINAGTSTIILSNNTTSTKTFSGGGATYYNLQIGGVTANTIATYTITGANTFNTISSTKTVASTITIPISVTNTVRTWAANGSAGNLITLKTPTNGTAGNLAAVAGVPNVGMNYVSLQDITFTPASSATQKFLWYLGANNTIGTNVTGSYLISTNTDEIYYQLTTGTSWTVPADFNSANNNVYIISGGGGGSGSVNAGATLNKAGGGGGGGGGFVSISNTSLTPGNSVSYAIGAAGAGSAGSTTGPSTASSGGTTTFNGTSAAGGGGAITTNAISAATAGTAGTGSTFNGGAGGSATFGLNTANGGGGGGGAGGIDGAGVTGTAGTTTGGAGGAGDNSVSLFVNASSVRYGVGATGGTGTTAPSAATGFGGGGGGGGTAVGSATLVSGSTGTQGTIVIRYRAVASSIITEGLTSADQVTVAFSFSGSLTEDSQLADSESTTKAYNPAITEDSQIADAETTQTNFNSSLAEDSQLADSESAVKVYTPSITEDSQLADSSSISLNISVSISEPLTSEEAANAFQAFFTAITENSNLGSLENWIPGIAVAITEGLTSGDAQTVAFAYSVNITENMTAAEFESVTQTVVSAITEALASADISSTTIGFGVSLTENSTAGDSSFNQNLFSVALSENLASGSNIVALLKPNVSVVEGFTALDPSNASADYRDCFMLERLVLLDLPNGYGWSVPSNAQTPNFTPTNTTQNPNLTPVINTQVPNWTPTNNSQ